MINEKNILRKTIGSPLLYQDMKDLMFLVVHDFSSKVSMIEHVVESL